MKWHVAVLLAVVVASACGGEPRHEGRSLDAWIADLRSPDADLQLRAMAACASMGASADAAIPTLVAVLREKGPVWSMAGVALSRMGKEAYAAVVPLTQDGDPGIRREAVRTIGKLAEAKADGRDGSPELLRHLADQDAEVRAVAAAYLGIVHQDAGAVVPALAKAIADPSALVRMNACKALAWFGTDSAPAIPELRRALEDSDQDVRKAAAYALLVHGEVSPK